MKPADERKPFTMLLLFMALMAALTLLPACAAPDPPMEEPDIPGRLLSLSAIVTALFVLGLLNASSKEMRMKEEKSESSSSWRPMSRASFQ